jgi:VWFA-related protein
MKKLTSLIITHALLLSLLAPLAGAQQPRIGPPQTTPAQPSPSSPAQPPAPEDEDDVVRITTNLVQVDAVVLDKKGKQVTDLTMDDFEILEDNRAQKLTNFSYILNESAPTPDAVAATDAARKSVKKGAPAEPPRRLRPEQVRRTMALVVDDLGLSFQSMDAVRTGLRKFVDEQMQPNDFVAIIRTSVGMGAMQQFTSDKRQLHAVIKGIKWLPGIVGGYSIFAPLTSQVRSGSMLPEGYPSGATEVELKQGMEADASASRLREYQEEIFAVGALGALNFIVRGMRELPGRKSVMLFSDGFTLRPGSDRVLQAVRQLTDLANRASVVFYTIDPRGLVAYNIGADEDTSGMTFEQIDQVQSRRASDLFVSQVGLVELTKNTGGLSLRNINNLDRSIGRVMNDQKGFYLLGYRPQSATFDRRYHKLEVRVKRPGLKVRYRHGFFGIRDEETRPVRQQTRYGQLLAALTSPFTAAGVRLRLTAVFGNSEQGGSFMTSLMHINGGDLKFTKQPDGTYQTVLDIVGLTYKDNGNIIDSRDHTTTLKLKEEAYRRALVDGLTYTFAVPIKKAGAYQLRMAVRDAGTTRTGSASQFIEVPDLKKNRLALSGLVVSGMRAEATVNTAAANTSSASSNSASEADSKLAETNGEQEILSSPAVRRFRPRSNLVFGYVIYNARLDRATNRPQLSAQTRIYRDGQLVYNGADEPLELSGYADVKRIDMAARLKLGANLTPGEYVLQIVVTDRLAKENDKQRVATQWVDFEIVGANGQ